MKDKHPRYQEWIKRVFDHPVTDPEWYLAETHEEFACTDEDAVILIEQTFTHAGTDLASFSDAQVDHGLWYLVGAAGSQPASALWNRSVPLDDRLRAIRSIYDLYTNSFASRCTQTLGHLNEPSSELNSICYMFWDLFWDLFRFRFTYPPVYKETQVEQALMDAGFSVLTDILSIPHRACREGALHGLGHMARQYPERVGDIIDRFLAANELDKPLDVYARNAREGAVL